MDNDEEVSTLFGYLEELHANFIRLCHYPHDERMTRAADRDGTMVWSKIPNWQHISFGKPEVYAKEVVMLKERIVGSTATLDDPLTKALDVVAVNEYIGWYGGTPEDAATMHWVLPEKPVIMSEFGAEAKYGSHNPLTQRLTEEQQADVYKQQLIMFSNIPQLRGITPWILMDFRSTTRNIPKLQDGHNRKGLISEDGEKKKAILSSATRLRGQHRRQGAVDARDALRSDRPRLRRANRLKTLKPRSSSS